MYKSGTSDFLIIEGGGVIQYKFQNSLKSVCQRFKVKDILLFNKIAMSTK